jgi:hypothetical protein
MKQLSSLLPRFSTEINEFLNPESIRHFELEELERAGGTMSIIEEDENPTTFLQVLQDQLVQHLELKNVP